MGSGLSKLASKDFVIGFFIPSLLFFAALRTVYGCAPWAASICGGSSGDLYKDLTLFAIVVWIVAVLLVAANYSLYRILEGYHLPSRLAEASRRRAQARVQRLVDREAALRSPERSDGTPKTDDERRSQKQQADKLRWRRLREFPQTPAEALPTRFGNAIRAFELYSGEMYGASSIAIWPLLQTVLPKDAMQRIDDARAQVDLFVNGSVLAFAFALFSGIRAIWLAGQGRDLTDRALLVALLSTIVGLLLLWLCYRSAIARVPAWGSTVKSAFDCYLPALAAQLGYTLPKSRDDRRLFWQKLSAQTIYRRPMNADELWSGVRGLEPPTTQDDIKDESDDET